MGLIKYAGIKAGKTGHELDGLNNSLSSCRLAATVVPSRHLANCNALFKIATANDCSD